MVISMVVIGDHWKYSHFTFTGRPGKKIIKGKKKVNESVSIPDIERTKVPESIICIKLFSQNCKAM